MQTRHTTRGVCDWHEWIRSIVLRYRFNVAPFRTIAVSYLHFGVERTESACVCTFNKAAFSERLLLPKLQNGKSNAFITIITSSFTLNQNKALVAQIKVDENRSSRRPKWESRQRKSVQPSDESQPFARRTRMVIIIATKRKMIKGEKWKRTSSTEQQVVLR